MNAEISTALYSRCTPFARMDVHSFKPGSARSDAHSSSSRVATNAAAWSSPPIRWSRSAARSSATRQSPPPSSTGSCTTATSSSFRARATDSNRGSALAWWRGARGSTTCAEAEAPCSTARVECSPPHPGRRHPRNAPLHQYPLDPFPDPVPPVIAAEPHQLVGEERPQPRPAQSASFASSCFARAADLKNRTGQDEQSETNEFEVGRGLTSSRTGEGKIYCLVYVCTEVASPKITSVVAVAV